MSITIQCMIKSIRDKLNEIDEMLKILNNFDIENNTSQKDKEEKK